MCKKDMFWYEQPADKWIEALPLGNGRMGAMVYGGTFLEKVQIDESTFWSGEGSKQNNKIKTNKLLWEIREKLLEEAFEEADRIGHGFVGNKNNYGTNMPVANLTMELDHQEGDVVQYQRSLHLAEGIAQTSFTLNGNTYEREMLVSNPAQIAAIKMSSDALFSMTIRYDGICNDTAIVSQETDAIYRIKGNARETLHSNGACGVHLEGCILVACDGKSRYLDKSIKISDCKNVVLYLDLETTMFHENPEKLAQKRVIDACKKGWNQIKREHVNDVAPMYERVGLHLEGEAIPLPTDKRIKRLASGEKDNELMSLMFQYGRYLLIASSRQDSPLPTHMGGIWNDNIYNRIDCTQDMHIDMNLQMQYWISAQCSLPECYQPFLNYVEQVLMPSGKETAKEVYHAGGWAAHVVSNPWGFTSLGWGYNWGAWSLGGTFCATLAWDYYEYGQDEKWLEEHGYPIIEGAAKFVLDYVFFDEKRGYYMTGPSYSPENMFRFKGKDYFLSLSNTCDMILVREILTIWQKAAAVLQKEKQACFEKAKKVLENLVPYQIGKKGQIQEWFYDFEEAIPNHRHTSHLLGLYPFHQIVPKKHPELAKAAEQSILGRMNQFEITSWGMNMLAGYYARLSKGEESIGIIKDVFKRLVKPNMASVMSDETSMWCGTWERIHMQSVSLPEENKSDTEEENTSPFSLRLAAYVLEHYHEELSLKSLAVHFKGNAAYIGQVFKRDMQVSFTEYLNSIRMEKAKEYLIKGNLSSKEVAAKVGFSNTTYFTTVFKKETGLSPDKYKKAGIEKLL